MTEPPSALFVYGTLKRGHANHYLIEPYVNSIQPAWLRGELYCVRQFPMLLEGEGVVRGELLAFEPDILERVLPLVDELEGYASDDPEQSLYLRTIVDVTTGPAEAASAYTYVYNRASATAGALGPLSRVPSGDWTGAP